MFIIIATATCQPDQHQAMADVLAILTAKSRDDDGCISYDFYTSLDDPDEFRSVEMWESAETAGAHLQQDHVATALEDLGPLLASPPSIIQYEVAQETTLA